MRLVFRSDASANTGAGHVMRSSAIAEEALTRGIECIFVGSLEGVDWIHERIRGLGFAGIFQPHRFNMDSSADVLILDSYSIEVDDEFIQPPKWKKTILIADDLTPSYRCDLIIHPGLDGSWYKGKRDIFLFGPQFIPLRKSITRRSHQTKTRLEKIVVFGGGSDPYGFAFSVAVILGGLMEFRRAVFFSNEKAAIMNLDSRFSVKNFGPELDEEIESADLVFTTASTSGLEVIARGVPVGVACSVSNQIVYHKAIGELGVASLVGERFSNGNWNLDIDEIRRIIEDSFYRTSFTEKSLGLIDFKGASRIVDAITDLFEGTK
jgi:spore coat polysaccharide biosynthesis predicted glycosyltransferase SpsG